jgi:hypothetical protein
MSIELFTIGFTRKSAREFFTLLKQSGVRRVLDVRLNNNSQLAGFGCGLCNPLISLICARFPLNANGAF